MTFTLFLFVVAVAFSGYVLIDSKGKGLVTWAVFCIALALLLPHLPFAPSWMR